MGAAQTARCGNKPREKEASSHTLDLLAVDESVLPSLEPFHDARHLRIVADKVLQGRKDRQTSRGQLVASWRHMR